MVGLLWIINNIGNAFGRRPFRGLDSRLAYVRWQSIYSRVDRKSVEHFLQKHVISSPSKVPRSVPLQHRSSAVDSFTTIDYSVGVYKPTGSGAS